MRILKPDTTEAVQDAICDAFETGTRLSIEGNGTKRHLGRIAREETTLKLSGLTGITMYEPDEMVFTARAGTPLAEIEQVLSSRGQCLAFEPAGKGATIGGVIAANIAGPRRFAAGAPRDHLLGFTAVNGKGERFKAGGRVVKNVTGYDLPKLAAGSFGTLFAMTEVTLRALPRGTSMVLALDDLDPASALKLLRAVAKSPYDPTGLAYVAAKSLALVRLEGQAEGVAARKDELCRSFTRGARVLDAAEGATWFRGLAEITPQLAATGALWRIAVPPARAVEAVDRLRPKTWVADWAGALLIAEFDNADRSVHSVAKALGGHAMLVRAPSPFDDPFPPLDEATLALTARLKDAFDPARILNPGRMYKDL